MKSKKNIKILLPLVVLIWGLVIYNIVDAFSSEDIAKNSHTTSSFKAPKVVEKETFAMLPISSDPFLGTIYHKPKANKKKQRKVIQEIEWPTIKYEGFISGATKKTTVFMLTINGYQHLVKKGDTLQRLKVLKGNQENIKLKYKGQTKEFPRM